MKGRNIRLNATDGHQFSAYEALPVGAPKGGVVVLQEIFGVTDNIRRVCDGYAERGYHTVAPCLFDRDKPGIELPYTQEGALKGRELRETIGWEHALVDTAAASKQLTRQYNVGIIGFCWGGTVASLAAARQKEVRAAVCYYPTLILPFVHEKPQCPVLMHFGEQDQFAPLSTAGTLRAHHGAVLEIQVYPTGHGFNCSDRADHHAPSAHLANERTLAFLSSQLAQT